MRSAEEILDRRTIRLSRLVPRLLTGRVTATEPFTVDAGGDTEIMPSRLGWWTPTLWESVWLLTWSGKALALGPSEVEQPEVFSVTGTVAATPAAGATLVTVNLASGQTVELPFTSGYSPVNGHTVWIAWADGLPGEGIVGGRPGRVPVPPPPKPPPPEPDPLPKPPQKPKIQRGTTTVRATDVRTARGGSWRGDTTKAFQGDWSGTGNNIGYFFYGGGFKSLRGATVTGVKVYLRRRAGGANAAEPMNIRRHTAKTRGSSPTGLTGSTMSSPGIKIGEGKWVTVPGLEAAVQAMVNAGQGGIAATGSGRADYAAWAGISGDGRDAMSGALKITWEKVT